MSAIETLTTAARPRPTGPAALGTSIETLQITAWSDPVVDMLGHDPRSVYVEQFWLPVLGPSCVWLLRRLATGLDAEPDGFRLPLADTARALGLGSPSSRNSPFVRAIIRCCQFGMAQQAGSDHLSVRRRLPPLTRQQVGRLPQHLQDQHAVMQELAGRTPSVELLRRRARRLALSLLELGEPLDAVENQLHHWHFHPAMAAEAVRWAGDHHRYVQPDDAA